MYLFDRKKDIYSTRRCLCFASANANDSNYIVDIKMRYIWGPVSNTFKKIKFLGLGGGDYLKSIDISFVNKSQLSAVKMCFYL